ncbi:Guanine nucleotide-binding protein subunit gamma 2 [Linum grandiflorum]
MRMENGNSSVVGDEQIIETRSSYDEEEEEEQEAESTITSPTVMTRRSTNSISSSPLPTTNNNGYFGKHRMAASLSILQLQIQSTQEELDQLESMGGSSAVCTELLTSVESTPDPLLPWSRGPPNESWERWFRGAHYNSRRRWI